MRICSCLAVSLILAVLGPAAAQDVAERDTRLVDLRELRASSLDGVVTFTDEDFARYAASPKRPYSLAIFLTARQMMDNAELVLPELRRQFGFASTAFLSGGMAPELFCVEMTFEDAQKTFQALGVNGLPFVYHLPRDAKVSVTKMDVPKVERMDLQSVKDKYPWQAETFVEFISRRTGFKAGAINRPSLVKSPAFMPLAALALGGFLFTAYQIYKSSIIREPVLWAVGSLVVYWFSTSGAMFNIIRGMPMTTRSRDGGVTYFLNQRGAQLGAEGFIMGGTYIAFSLCISFLTYAVPLIKDRSQRMILGCLSAGMASYIVYKIFEVYMWKSGYRFVPYF